METTPGIGVKRLVLSIVSVACVEMALQAIPVTSQSQAMVALGLARLIEILLLVTILSLGEGLSVIGLSFPGLMLGIKTGGLWAVAIGCAAFLCFGIFRLLGTNLLSMIPISMPPANEDILLLFCVGGMAGPIAEELFFRGIVYSFLRRWGVVVALAVSTVLFLLAHPGVFHRIPVIQAMGGVLFALSYEREKNLIVPITIHVLGNMSIVLLSLGTLSSL